MDRGSNRPVANMNNAIPAMNVLLEFRARPIARDPDDVPTVNRCKRCFRHDNGPTKVSDDVALRQWHVEAYNDALADMQKEGKGRLNPQAALPLWDMDASLKELDRIRKLGLTGIVMSDKPSDFGMPSLGDPVWHRFFATCQALGLPVNFHIGSGSFEGEMAKWWNPSKIVVNDDNSLNGPISIFSAVNSTDSHSR